jgi:hypothetical protein
VSREAAPHETSLAVWDIPSPLALGGPAKLKVGLRCSAGCPLTGQKIEIRDAAQNCVAAAKLGPAPWPGTAGLYWGEADVVAPLAEGTHVWRAQYSPADLEAPHLGSALTFGLTTAKPPEHRVTVEVLQQNTNTVIDSAEVRLEVYRTLTNTNGIAMLEVPRGTYELNVWKMGYEFVTRNLEVNSDQCLRIELPVEPEPSPFGEM